MKMINADYIILNPDIDDYKVCNGIYRMIERAGRTCYKSEDKVTDESAKKFVKLLTHNHHEAMLEHAHMTVKFIIDRGVSHELVRHRLASFAQESTRYCNYSVLEKFGNEITVIRPCYLKDSSTAAFNAWSRACVAAERGYFDMLKAGCKPEEARAVLPNSLKTEVIVTANMREWRHILNLRAAGATGKPHPQMLEVMVPLLNELRAKLPYLFKDIQPMEVGENE